MSVNAVCKRVTLMVCIYHCVYTASSFYFGAFGLSVFYHGDTWMFVRTKWSHCRSLCNPVDAVTGLRVALRRWRRWRRPCAPFPWAAVPSASGRTASSTGPLPRWVTHRAPTTHTYGEPHPNKLMPTQSLVNTAAITHIECRVHILTRCMHAAARRSSFTHRAMFTIALRLYRVLPCNM